MNDNFFGTFPNKLLGLFSRYILEYKILDIFVVKMFSLLFAQSHMQQINVLPN